MSFRVSAPASSANLGPGFDSLAIALDLWLHVEVERCSGKTIHDLGGQDLHGGENLVIEAMRFTAEQRGWTLPGCGVRVSSGIPVARGLGSSAAAIVAGIRAAAVLAGQADLDDREVVAIGGAMEGHADNVSASALGGVTVAVATEESYLAEVLASRLPWAPVLFIPDAVALTKEARGILPDLVPLSDAAANVGRSALLALALQTGRDELLREAMLDALHQPYRSAIFPHLQPAIAAAAAAGAFGASLSGAGPTVLALASPADARAVGEAMAAAAAYVGVAGRAMELGIPAGGCVVEFAGFPPP